MNILSKISSLNGIGEKRENLFNAKGIYTILDLLFYLPRTFKDYSSVHKINEEVFKEYLYSVTVDTKPSYGFSKRMKNYVSFQVSDDSGQALVYYFNMSYMAGQITKGEEFYLFGKMQKKDNKRYIVNPNIHRKLEQEIKFMPVYPHIYGISQKMIMKSIQNALKYIDDTKDCLSDQFKAEFSLPDFYQAHKDNHFPNDPALNLYAKRRFAMEELLVFLCMIENMSYSKNRCNNLYIPKINTLQTFVDRFDFGFTQAQMKAMQDIKSDFESGFVMNRLVQGDVGCGKTAVAFYAMYLSYIQGYQSVMMAPTEILASQHYHNARQKFSDIGMELITASNTKQQREQALMRIMTGESSMIFGTHALLFGDIRYKDLFLAITDEQHRFGVSQRAKISYNGKLNTLVMSATPIPRTLALVLYSNIDVSIINELPKGRKKIKTHIVNDSKRKRMYEFIHKECEKGFQAYVVCPLIEGAKEDKSVYNVLSELKKDFGFKNCEAMHGKMMDREKNEIVTRFKDGKISVLVSTTVIEVGIDVKNVTIIAIEQAEKFGISTLHQLRGRVGRGDEASYCFLVSGTKNARLDALKEQSDGFVLAQMDLDLRGPGQFLGKKQHGIDDFYMHKLLYDTKLVNETKQIFERMKNGEFVHEYQMAQNNAKIKQEHIQKEIALN